MLLGHRRALHTLPTDTLQQLQQQSMKQQQQPETWEGSVDVAGLPVPVHNCCLLPGGVEWGQAWVTGTEERLITKHSYRLNHHA
jgi:hypothetical protein